MKTGRQDWIEKKEKTKLMILFCAEFVFVSLLSLENIFKGFLFL